MSPELIEVLSETGIAGISVGITAYMFMQVMKAHRHERTEWRDDIGKDRERSDTVLKELTTVIREINNK